MHVRTTCKLLKRFPRNDQILFMNVVVGDESWIHYLEPHRKIRYPVWLTQKTKQECIVLTEDNQCVKGYVCHIYHY